jgi:hypothetical protein
MIGVRFPAEAGNFFLLHRVHTGSVVHPASYPVGTVGSFRGVKRPGREADHSSASSAEVKKVWGYTTTPAICIHGAVLSEAQGQLYLTCCFLSLWSQYFHQYVIRKRFLSLSLS